MADDPSGAYRYAYRLQYPKDHRKYAEDLIRRFISLDYEDWEVLVIDAEDSLLGYTRVVAFPIRDQSYVNIMKYGSKYVPESRVLYLVVSFNPKTILMGKWMRAG